MEAKASLEDAIEIVARKLPPEGITLQEFGKQVFALVDKAQHKDLKKQFFARVKQHGMFYEIKVYPGPNHSKLM